MEEDDLEIKMTRVESSHIRGIGYDHILGGLIIDFHTRDFEHVYFYQNVDIKVYNRLLAAKSKGKFFWNNIRFQYIYFIIQ